MCLSCRHRVQGTYATSRAATAPRALGAPCCPPSQCDGVGVPVKRSRSDRSAEERRVTIRLTGEHDVSTTPDMTRWIDAALQSGADCIWVNLDAVTFLDASVLGTLVRGRSRCVARDAQFVVTCSNQRLRRLFALTKLAALLHDHH
jgi:anti-sigma B factor antagonist